MNLSQLTAFRAIVARVPKNALISNDVLAILNRIGDEITSLAKIDDPSTRDELKSATYYDMLTNAAKTSLRTLIADSREKLQAILTKYAAKLNADRLEKANLVPDAFAAELRTVFRGLDWQSKIAFMSDCNNSKSGVLAAAILNFHPVLSGLNDEQANNFKESFLQVAAGNSNTALVEQIKDSVDVALDTAVQIAQ